MNTARQEQLWPSGFQKSAPLDNADLLASCFGGLKQLPNVPFLEAHDQRLDDFREAGCDIDEILVWANDGDTIFRRNRIQLLTSFPLLVPRLASLNRETHPLMLAVGAGVDRGDTLVDSLASIFGLSKSAIRHFCGRPVAQIGSRWTSDPAEALFAIDVAPVEARPHSRQDWEVFRRYWRYSQLGIWGCGLWGPSRIRSFIEEYVFQSLCRLGYTEASERRLYRMTDNQPSSLDQVIDYIMFALEWSRDTFPEAQGLAWGTLNQRPSTFDVFMMRYPLAELIRQSVVWHKEISSVTPASESDTPASGCAVNDWPGLLMTPLPVGHLSVTSLVSRVQLVEEGFRLQHCVGSYSDRCLMGGTHIVSFRDRQGGSLSTAEIEFDLDGGRWTPRVIQHYGFENSAPPLECSLALDRVIQHLQEANLQAWIWAIQFEHEQRREQIESQLWAAKNARARMGNAMMRKVLPDFDVAYDWLEAKAEA